ncbi:MAG: methyltransferase domain-containing protein [Methanosphaera stadtmanae]|nr:methyltransferase domain-containing protein [Methanosphaera stadtmanae]
MANFKDKIITKDDFNEMLEKNSYYKGRWAYFNEIITQLHKMENINTVLEMGPYKLPFVKGSDVIDFTEKYREDYPFEVSNFIKHDCSKTPYPIKDKKYDLVIACQVLEHLGIHGEQVKIFKELKRISKRVLLSLPYKWFVPNMRDHHMIDKRMIKTWTKMEPTYELVSATRILQLYEFEDESSEHTNNKENMSSKNSELESKINILTKKINSAENELNILKNENKKLKEENVRLNDKFDEIINSNSWKYTEPIRNIKNKYVK